MEVLEVCYLPLWVGPALSGWLTTFFGGEFYLGGVTTPWVWADLPKKGLLPPIEGRALTLKVVADLNNVYENAYFVSTPQ